jgi:hypothetical protein
MLIHRMHAHTHSGGVWERAYAPVAHKCQQHPPAYTSLDEFEAEVRAARQAAAKGMRGLEQDFNVYMSFEAQREALLADRNRCPVSPRP